MMDLSHNCIINVCLKQNSQFHKVDDLTVPDDNVRSEVCVCDVLTEGVLQVSSEVHPLRQKAKGKVHDNM